MDTNARIPSHIAVIMDGNGRWATRHNLPRTLGHRKGVKAAERIVDACMDAGVPYLTLFCFSSENWNRPADEVDALMDLMRSYLQGDVSKLLKKGVRLDFAGRLDRLPADIQKQIAEVRSANVENPRLTVVMALSYGGREEITDAARRMAGLAAEGGIDPASVDEECFSRFLYLPDVPDPDLLIRTGGEKRISNFLLWQSAYAEIVFSDTLWPDFSEECLQDALKEYSRRERRFGKV